MKRVNDLDIKEIKDNIEEITNQILDALNVHGIGRKLIDNQLQMYLQNKNNDLDIQIAFFKLIKMLQDRFLLS